MEKCYIDPRIYPPSMVYIKEGASMFQYWRILQLYKALCLLELEFNIWNYLKMVKFTMLKRNIAQWKSIRLHTRSPHVGIHSINKLFLNKNSMMCTYVSCLLRSSTYCISVKRFKHSLLPTRLRSSKGQRVFNDHTLYIHLSIYVFNTERMIYLWGISFHFLRYHRILMYIHY